jgi:hypothetical protein
MKVNSPIILDELLSKCVDRDRSSVIPGYLSQSFHNVASGKLSHIFSLRSPEVKLQELLEAAGSTHVMCNSS